MEAAMVPSLVQLVSSVVTLCTKYESSNKDIKMGIVRLTSQIRQLQTALEKAQESAENDGFSPISDKTTDDVKVLLVPLKDRLKIDKGELSMTCFGLRSYSWPLERKDVEDIINQADRLKATIQIGLQTMSLQRLQINNYNQIGTLEEEKKPLDDGVTFEYCLSILSRSLKKDICDINRPDTLVEEVGRDKIERAIPQDLQYACRHWVDHLQEEIDDDSLDKSEEFLKKHVLHWFEAMSLLELTSPCVLIIRQLQSIVSTHYSHRQTLSTLLYDCWRFILRNRSIIETAPLQTYSALVFSPQNSILRTDKALVENVPAWLSLGESILANWDPALQSLQGHRNKVSSTAFSPDGKWIASSSYDDTVRIWNANTGVLYRVLEGPTYLIGEVAFLDNCRVACKSLITFEYWIWDLETGKSQDPQLSAEEESMFRRRPPIMSQDGNLYLDDIEGHARFIGKVDGPLDGFYLKDAHSGAILSTLLHGGSALESAFSPDDKLIVSYGSHNTVRLWDAKVPNSERTYESHSDYVFHIASSARSGLVASASKDKTVRLWDPVKRNTHHVLKAEDMQAAWIVEFSPDGKLIATGSEDSTVRLWDTTTGNLVRTFNGHSRGIWALTFSEDGSRLASASIDNTVIVWNTATGDKIEQFETEVVKDDAHGNPNIWYNENFDAVYRPGVLFNGTTSYAICHHQRLRLMDRKNWKTSKMIQFSGPIIWSRISHDQQSVYSKHGVLQYQASSPGSPSCISPSDLKLDDGWVSWKATRLLKLPEGNIPSTIAGKGNVLVLGYDDGEVRFITIKPEEIH